jgi:hypothetical protein
MYGELVHRPSETHGLLGSSVRVQFREHAGGQKLPYFELCA